MLNIIKGEHEKSKQLEEPDSTWTLKLDKKSPKDSNAQNEDDSEIYTGFATNCITITEADENEVEMDKHDEMIREAYRMRNIRCKNEERKQRESKVAKLSESCVNEVTIQETSLCPESSMSQAIHIDVTPDVSIVMDIVDTSENENNHEILEEPVSPPPSTDMMSTCSIFNSTGVPILVPYVTNSGHVKYISDPAEISRGYQRATTLNSDERRKQRNREASRRYRERAREDPELLKKMREQQNARQKKYYARLRMKKMSSGEWDTAGEEEQGIGYQ